MTSARNLNDTECLEGLLKILSCKFGTDNFSNLAKADWLFMLNLIRWHRIARATLNSIVDSNIVVPDYFLVSLQELSKKNAANNLAQTALLPKIKKSLNDEQIPFLFLKGIFLSMQLHQSLVERHSKDIDIWVSEDHISKAVYALESAGFKLIKPSIKLSDNDLKKYMVNQKDMVFRSVDSVIVEVELHWRLDKNCYSFPLDFHDAYSRHEQVTINNQIYPTISLIDNFFYLSSHGSSALYGRLKWLLDWQKISKLIDKQPSLIDKHEVAEYAYKMSAQSRQVSLSNYLLQKIDTQVSNTKFERLGFFEYSILIKLIANSVVNNWANLSYMRLVKRWCFRLFLVKGISYKVEQFRLAFALLVAKLFFKKGVYQ